jgi:CheY-like chemotaxis protein
MGGYVLVVDDDQAVRTVISETFRGDGQEVICAEDGDEALRLMAGKAVPQLVILDLMMPRVTGWRVLECMEANPRLAAIPVVVLTSFDACTDLPAGRSVVHKPIDGALLLDLAHSLIEQERQLEFSLSETPSDLMPRRPPPS